MIWDCDFVLAEAEPCIITHAETNAIIYKGFTRHCATKFSGNPTAVDKKKQFIYGMLSRDNR